MMRVKSLLWKFVKDIENEKEFIKTYGSLF